MTQGLSVSLQVGDIIPQLTVIDLLVDGGAIAKHEGVAIFLDECVPGDVVSARIVKQQKRFFQAEVVEKIVSSAHTVPAHCKYFGICGGCSWQNISYDFLLDWKKKHVSETLKRIGGIELPVADVVPSPQDKFRTKVVYSFGVEYQGRNSADDENAKQIAGLKKRNSNEVVAIDSCPLQTGKGEPVLQFLREELLENFPVWHENTGYLRYMILHTPSLCDTDDTHPHAVLEIITAAENKEVQQHARLAAVLKATVEKFSNFLQGAVHSVRLKPSAIAQGEKLQYSVGTVDLQEYYNGEAITFPPDGFMQTNTAIAQKLYAKAIDVAQVLPEDKVWDLFCGVGVIGLLCAKKAATLFGVDGQKNAILYARKNAQRLGVEKKTQFRFGAIDEQTANATDTPDCIFIDPPRGGCSSSLIDLLAKSSAKTLLYISCDVATQARDCKLLTAHGWKAVAAYPYDMFPFTPHLENIVLMIRL